MISPQEIRTVTFDKVMRGYRTEDVDALLQQLAQQMEELQAEKESTEKKAQSKPSLQCVVESPPKSPAAGPEAPFLFFSARTH